MTYEEVVALAFDEEFAYLEDLRNRGHLSKEGRHSLASLRSLKSKIDFRAGKAACIPGSLADCMAEIKDMLNRYDAPCIRMAAAILIGLGT
jgi:hypothetical protein